MDHAQQLVGGGEDGALVAQAGGQCPRVAAACFRASLAGEPSPDRGTDGPGPRRLPADRRRFVAAAKRGRSGRRTAPPSSAARQQRRRRASPRTVALERGRLGRGGRRSPVQQLEGVWRAVARRGGAACRGAHRGRAQRTPQTVRGRGSDNGASVNQAAPKFPRSRSRSLYRRTSEPARR